MMDGGIEIPTRPDTPGTYLLVLRAVVDRKEAHVGPFALDFFM